MSNQEGTIIVPSEKLYTQNEVDNLILKSKGSSLTDAGEIKKEAQVANKQKRLNKAVVANLVKKSNRILVSVSSHAFPIDVFPNTINIEEGRITIIKRHLLSSAVHSIDIKDISNVFINTTLFFSQLVIISNTFEQNEIRLRNLRNNEAVFVRRIIEGLRIFEKNQVDTFNYSKEELIAKLEELSSTEIVI